MYEAGSIVLIPFPFSDLSSSKRRPVLMLTTADARNDFIAMPLTSKPQPSPSLALTAGPLPEGGHLPLASWIKTDTAFSLSTTQVIKTLGRISEENRIYCVQQFCRYLRQGR
ncbi:MAG: type II toxin-antitoxin system PemK/MazF family toxin [Dechloromonas sp.]|nr:MAG: type II toxin-antitoxin system PemK/MazF family toxin [Dechloromonas sp.]